MPKRLTEAQVAHYRDHGFVCPIDGIGADEALRIRRDMADFEAETGLSLRHDLHFKTHMYFASLVDLTLRSEILDAVEDLIGPDILVFASNFWSKAGGDRTYVSWHQDSAYFGLDPHDEVTVWIAITDSTPDNGCMRVIPGSHKGPALDHVETFAEDNLLARGQEIRGVDESRAVDLVLRAGQFSIHNERTVHGSLPNAGDDARIGFSLMMIPAIRLI